MSDLWSKQQAFNTAVVTSVCWFLVFATPFMIVWVGAKLDALAWCAILVFIGYFGYTGIRARQRGGKSKFILRVVVPGALFATSWLTIALLTWLAP